jgi:hypothetical protein
MRLNDRDQALSGFKQMRQLKKLDVSGNMLAG